MKNFGTFLNNFPDINSFKCNDHKEKENKTIYKEQNISLDNELIEELEKKGTYKRCPHCEGKRFFKEKKCKVCNGEGIIKRRKDENIF